MTDFKEIDIEAILVYWHLKGLIDIGKYISHTYYNRDNNILLGYNIYQNHNSSYAIIKNKYIYMILPYVDLIDLYNYLINNEFIKSIGLKFEYNQRNQNNKHTIDSNNNCILGSPSGYFIHSIRPT